MEGSSLKRKLIIFVIIIITPIATSNIISLIISKRINENYNFMLQKMNVTNEIKSNLNDSLYYFNDYILTNTSSSKSLYEAGYNSAIDNLILLEENSDLKSKYILRDLLNSIKSYKEAGDNTIKLYSSQLGVDEYYDSYISAKDILSYCNIFLSKLSDSYLDYNSVIYDNLKVKEKFIYKVLIIYICTAIFICIIYTIFFLRNITGNLNELVSASKKVAKGDFTGYKGKKTFIYELDILSDAFSSMIYYIKKYINSLKENAELEKKLREEETKILKYENALKLSQLKVLQAQINPHFLFNTLNCINQTAMKENAVKTENLIRSVSGILRYSISMMDRNATLEEEINVVKQYMFIQQFRFDDRVKFNLNIDADLTKVKVPGMTLQPFVENAFIHGIEPKEEGGLINIEICEKENCFLVLIEDTGCGIEEEILSKITSEKHNQEHIGHTTGIGIKSVVERLELMYNTKDIFFIESKKGTGTKVYLQIPIKELERVC